MTSILQKYLNANVNSNKEASNSSVTDAAKFVGKNIVLPLGLTAGAAVLAHKVNQYLDQPKKVDPLKIKEIVSIKPNLKSVHPDLLNTYYSIMHREAPRIMEHPHVAANILERVVNYGGIDHTLLKDLAESENAVNERAKIRSDFAQKTLGTAVKMMSMY